MGNLLSAAADHRDAPPLQRGFAVLGRFGGAFLKSRRAGVVDDSKVRARQLRTCSESGPSLADGPITDIPVDGSNGRCIVSFKISGARWVTYSCCLFALREGSMKPRVVNFDQFSSQNEPFLTAVNAVVNDIFQTEHLGRVGYLKGPEYDPTRYPVQVPGHSRVIEGVTCPIESRGSGLELGALGPSEQVLASAIFEGEYTLVVVAGALGSGKTTAITEVIEAISGQGDPTHRRHCGACEVRDFVVKFDFLQDMVDTKDNVTDTTRRFKRNFFNKLKIALRKTLAQTLRGQSVPVVDGFLNDISGSVSRRLDAYPFDDFLETHFSNPDWHRQSAKGRIADLLRFVAEIEDSCDRYHAVSMLINFAIQNLFDRPACCIIVLDNIDRYPPDIQNDTLKDALAFSSTCAARVVLTVRLTAFAHHLSLGSYSFGLHKHCGPPPEDVVAARIRHFFEHESEYESQTRLDPHLATDLQVRLRRVLELLEYERSRFRKFVFCLSGHSIRCGLFLCERSVRTSVARYNDKLNVDDACRALLLGNAERMSEDDSLCANILIDRQQRISLLRTRLLHITRCRLAHNLPCSIGLLLEDVFRYKEWTESDVLDAFNALLHPFRRLIWINTRQEFSTYQELVNSRNTLVSLTTRGKRYVVDLLSMLVYLQECFLACERSEEVSPEVIDYRNLADRMRFVRLCLREVRGLDEREHRRYRGSGGDIWPEVQQKALSSNVFMLSSYMIAGAALSVRRILQAAKRREGPDRRFDDEREELESWHSLVTDTVNAEAQYSGAASRYILDAQRAYEDQRGRS